MKYAYKYLNKNKSCSWDLIQENHLKTILNKYLTLGIIPEELTTSRLLFLNKKANEVGDINNLRLIAISSTFIKIIESALLTRILKQVNDNKILCNEQIGFIKGCWTELNLLKLRQKVSDIKKENNFYTKYLIFIDLKNTYDKVIHKRLFCKLSEQGINEEIIGTIKLLFSKAKYQKKI